MNYISQLYEYGQKHRVKIILSISPEQTDQGQPVFLATYEVFGKKATGYGKNKNAAKNDAAEKIMQLLGHDVDISDSVLSYQSVGFRRPLSPKTPTEIPYDINDEHPAQTYTGELNSVSQSTGVKVWYEEEQAKRTETNYYYVKCKADQFECEGKGKSKKEAKHNASKQMLELLGHKSKTEWKLPQSPENNGVQYESEIRRLTEEVQRLKNEEKLSIEKHENEMQALVKKLKEEEIDERRKYEIEITALKDQNKLYISDIMKLKEKLALQEKVDTSFVSRFAEDYDKLNYIGDGGFAVVFSGENKIDETSYAIKRVPLPRCEKAKTKILREVKALARLEHPSIVRYYTAWWEAPPKDWQVESDKVQFGKDSSWIGPPEWQLTPFSNLTNGYTESVHLYGRCTDESCNCLKSPPLYLYIQMELCEQTLKKWLLDRKNVTPESIKIFVQIVEAVAFFHEQNMIHRDLKPGNIFLSQRGSKLDIKVGDFGLATEMSRILDTSSGRRTRINRSQNHTAGVGTEFYKAPEQQSSQKYDHKVDIYALGVIFLELYHQMRSHHERYQVLYNLKSGNLPASMNESQRQFVKLLTDQDPRNRPDAAFIQQSDEFKSICTDP